MAPRTRVRLAILGSSGSIGQSALRIVERYPDRFELVGIAAKSSTAIIAQQVRKFKPRVVALHEERLLDDLRERIGSDSSTEIIAGSSAAVQLAADPEVDVVLAAIVGIAGLESVMAGLGSGKRVALANKESLVCAGQLVSALQAKSGSELIPVDSEHSAIFQALQGSLRQDIAGILLTASGGPFLDLPRELFRSVTPQQAVRHPRWSMGAKISVDSATLMNKALEVIEAHWLFGLAVDKIEVLIHPQSIVHSAVKFVDGSEVAQLSVPDMCGPISYALLWPDGRLDGLMPGLGLSQRARLEFFALDEVKFPAVNLARQCVTAGGVMPAVFNCANEAAVAAFLKGAVTFDRISELVEGALGGENWPGSFD